jgi:hypothetical protein
MIVPYLYFLTEWTKSSLEKLFGNSAWVPSWGYESGQEGSKESRLADSCRQ